MSQKEIYEEGDILPLSPRPNKFAPVATAHPRGIRHIHHEQRPPHAKNEWIRCVRGILFPPRCANRADGQFL